MKNFRQLCAVVVLTLALSFSASAGDILVPGATPTPQPISSTKTTSVPAETCNLGPGDILVPGATVDPVTEAALSLLYSLLSIF
jgi:hypothetical protein